MDGSGLGLHDTIAASGRWRIHLQFGVHGRFSARFDVLPEPKRSGDFHRIVITTTLRRVGTCNVALERLDGMGLVRDHPFHKVAD